MLLILHENQYKSEDICLNFYKEDISEEEWNFIAKVFMKLGWDAIEDPGSYSLYFMQSPEKKGILDYMPREDKATGTVQ